MRTLIIVALITFVVIQSYARHEPDTSYWRMGGIAALTVSQVSLSNWVGGGQNSASGNLKFIYSAIRTKNRGVWENRLDLGYGIIKQGNSAPDKSDDKISFYTELGYKLSADNDKWFFSGFLDFKSQFDKGFDPNNDSILISDWMAPGYIVVGTGIEYKPNSKLSFSANPLAGKFTFVRVQELADKGDYEVEPAVRDEDGNIETPGKNLRTELGGFFRGTLITPIFESRLELFANYTENTGNIDVNWQNMLVVQATKLISMNLYTELIYDDDIEITNADETDAKPRIQFKSVIGVGVAYRFGEVLE